jgi:halogenation protein CepH
MALTEQFDLIVVGGGPAGSTLATLVAMQNHSVLLLEKEAFPRYQIGESLLPATIHGICTILGIKGQIERAGFTRKRGGTFRWGANAEPWTFDFGVSAAMTSETSFAYQVERSKFDHILLENARHKGVDVRERHTIVDLIWDEGRVAGVRFIDADGHEAVAKASYVADASGNESRLARQVGERVYSKFFQNIAFFCYFRGGKRLPSPNEGNILCAAFREGWFWYIPLSETLTSVGAVIAKQHADLLRQEYETAMQGFVASCPLIRDYLSEAQRVVEGPYGRFRTRKDYSYSNTRFWQPGIVLVGDAACFVDPVFSSGVHLATYSALLAARSINTCLTGTLPEDRCFTEFEMRYRQEFSNFYEFLLAFYDTNSDQESYFWKARKILHTEERAYEAFVRLVAGMSSSNELSTPMGADYFDARKGIGEMFLDPAGLYDLRANGDDSRRAQGTKLQQALTREIVQMHSQAALGAARPPEMPSFPGGLIPSADGFRWRLPTGAAANSAR